MRYSIESQTVFGVSLAPLQEFSTQVCSKKYENMKTPGKGFEPLSADAQPFSRRPPYHLANLAIILGIVSQIKKSV